MAISTYYSPLPAELDEDAVTLKVAVGLLARTGHKTPRTTLDRWIREDGITTVRVGRTDYVSWSDILDAHYKRTAVKLRASSNWP